MNTKGACHIRGIRSLNTRPGPVTESGALLRMYLLAVEKDNLLKKLTWVRQQEQQAEKRLAEIGRAMHAVKKTVGERVGREQTIPSSSGSRSAPIQY